MNAQLNPASLWPRVRDQFQKAGRSGALVSLNTEVRILTEAEVTFAVRIAVDLARKPPAGATAKDQDPFIPPFEPDLYVGQISNTHEALLNKFNVLDNHLLLVTRRDAGQTERLDVSDCRALLYGLAGIDGLAFYNGGTAGGASQRHKHLQIVPFPLAPGVKGAPVTTLFQDSEPLKGDVRHCPALPFRHALAPMPAQWTRDPDGAAEALQRRYEALWQALGYSLTGSQQPVPYNLLATHDWLWLAPRSKEKHLGISVNALGFAGALLVRDQAAFEQLRDCGPMRLLTAVGC